MMNVPLDRLPENANNVLVLVPPLGQQAMDTCSAFSAHSASVGARYFAISYARDADSYVRHWRDHVESPPESMVIVETRAGESLQETEVPDGWNLRIRTESPGDLTGLGIQTSEFLTRWHDLDDPITICFDSLTVLLQYVPVEQAFRFLHTFTTRVRNAGATAHYHMSPSAHDDQTVETLVQLFDAVVEADDEGDGYAVRA